MGFKKKKCTQNKKSNPGGAKAQEIKKDPVIFFQISETSL